MESNHRLKRLFIPVFAVYILHLFIPPMEIDAAQYAEMSREMLHSDNWLHLFDLGRDYLDKPPFLFWVSALSMKIFGISPLGYKLPSTLFALLSIYTLYRFTMLWYSEKLAIYAALILASCQAVFLITNDIRTDTILMSFCLLAFWQLSRWIKGISQYSWISAAVFIGLGMMTKGPIALIIIGMGFLPHFIIKKQWKYLLRWEYIPMLLIIGITLIPMSYGLYTQFDTQPEKFVNNEYGVSGLRFFYWTQSFGRITGESVWNNNAPFYFLYMNLLWGLLPFTLFFIAGSVRSIFRLKENKYQIEWISTSAVVLAYISLGISNFQLPHYIYVVLPFICLLTARYIISIQKHFNHKYRILQLPHTFLFGLVAICIPIAMWFSFPQANVIQIILLFAAAISMLVLLYMFRKKRLDFISMLVLIAVTYNIILSQFFYPNLMRYQKEFALAKKINEDSIPTNKIIAFKQAIGRSLDFNVQYDIPLAKKINRLTKYDYIITNKKGKAQLKKNNIKTKELFSGLDYSIALLQIGFLNPNKRADYCKKYFILKKIP